MGGKKYDPADNYRPLADSRFCDIDGRKVKLTAGQRGELEGVWREHDLARSWFALERRRSRYNRVGETGAELVRVQAKLGVWLIHPCNVHAGLPVDDPGIVEDLVV